jgi:hypothetical protein
VDQTCRAEDGSCVRVCGPCWEARTHELMIVHGDGVVTVAVTVAGRTSTPGEWRSSVPVAAITPTWGRVGMREEGPAGEAVVTVIQGNHEGEQRP